MTAEEKFYTIKAMEQYGGGFVAALAGAFARADARNSARIVAAFTDYMEQYGPTSAFYRRVVESAKDGA